MPPNPHDPPSKADQLVFGADTCRHPITGHCLQRGFGALSVKEQARQHLRTIEYAEGKMAADAVRKALDEFEAAGGVVEAPPANVAIGFGRATKGRVL